MEIMNGKELSSKIKDEIKDEVESCFKTPILAVITIGYNAASEVYIKNISTGQKYKSNLSVEIRDSLIYELETLIEKDKIIIL